MDILHHVDYLKYPNPYEKSPRGLLNQRDYSDSGGNSDDDNDDDDLVQKEVMFDFDNEDIILLTSNNDSGSGNGLYSESLVIARSG